MNILLTSVGRRSYMVEYFKKAVEKNDLIIGVNSNTNTTGMAIVDKAYTVPEVNSESYIPTLLDICKKENIGLVVSLFDIDLFYLSKEKHKFENEGIKVAISDSWVIETANDKWESYHFLNKNGIKSPRTYISLDQFSCDFNSGNIDFPLIVKPRWGMGSIAVCKAENYKELCFFYEYVKNQIQRSYLNILSSNSIETSVLIQEFISGTEYGVDVFNSLNGDHIATIVKQKLEMRAGETDSAFTVENKIIENISNKLGSLLRHRANLDIDIIVSENNNEPYILEFNPRFGGGYPFSHLAGVNFPKLLVQMASGQELDQSLIKPKIGVKVFKFIVPRVVY